MKEGRRQGLKKLRVLALKSSRHSDELTNVSGAKMSNAPSVDENIPPFPIYCNAWAFREKYSYKHTEFSKDDVLGENFPFYKTLFS